MVQQRAFAPEGHLRIAQRFIAGSEVPQGLFRPGGTIETHSDESDSIVPPGLDGALKSCPSDKSLGYSHTSLRDGQAGTDH